MIDLNDLLTRSADKDQVAFKALYDATSPRLFSVLMGMLKNESLAEDILQDSFLKIWEKAETFKASKSNGMTWMRTITTNTARDKLRALKSYDRAFTSYPSNERFKRSTARVSNPILLPRLLTC